MQLFHLDFSNENGDKIVYLLLKQVTAFPV